jgi:2'-5' RNA ligase
VRIFISVELPEEIKKKIFKATAEMRAIESGIKWVEEQNLHLTLKFLGWVEDNDLERLKSLTEEAVKGFGAFKIKLEGFGSFPGGKTPRVLWIGITEGAEHLIGIANSLEKSLSGFRSEERGFSAHLTIGRVKDKKGVDEVNNKLAQIKDLSFSETVVDDVKIMKSTLTRKGPVYEMYHRIVLGR